MATLATERRETLHELLRLCPVFWQDATEFTPACMAALDARYLDGFVDEGYGYPRVADSLTWRAVFEDARRTRGGVVEALLDPDCRVRGGFVRPELRQICAADDMARLAVLHRECGQVLTMDDEYGGAHDNHWEWQLDRLARQASDQEDYYRRRFSAEDHQLRVAWRLRRCRAARAGVEWIDSLPMPGGGMVDHDQGWHLNGVAARLGSPRAMLAYSNPDDEAHLNALAEFEPAIAYYHLAKRSQPADQEAFIRVARHYSEILGRGAPLDWNGLEWSRGRIPMQSQGDDDISLHVQRIVLAGWQSLAVPFAAEPDPERLPGTKVTRIGDQVVVRRLASPDDDEESGDDGIDWLEPALSRGTAKEAASERERGR